MWSRKESKESSHFYVKFDDGDRMVLARGRIKDEGRIVAGTLVLNAQWGGRKEECAAATVIAEGTWQEMEKQRKEHEQEKKKIHRTKQNVPRQPAKTTALKTSAPRCPAGKTTVTKAKLKSGKPAAKIVKLCGGKERDFNISDSTTDEESPSVSLSSSPLPVVNSSSVSGTSLCISSVSCSGIPLVSTCSSVLASPLFSTYQSSSASFSMPSSASVSSSASFSVSPSASFSVPPSASSVPSKSLPVVNSSSVSANSLCGSSVSSFVPLVSTCSSVPALPLFSTYQSSPASSMPSSASSSVPSSASSVPSSASFSMPSSASFSVPSSDSFSVPSSVSSVPSISSPVVNSSFVSASFSLGSSGSSFIPLFSVAPLTSYSSCSRPLFNTISAVSTCSTVPAFPFSSTYQSANLSYSPVSSTVCSSSSYVPAHSFFTGSSAAHIPPLSPVRPSPLTPVSSYQSPNTSEPANLTLLSPTLQSPFTPNRDTNGRTLAILSRKMDAINKRMDAADIRGRRIENKLDELLFIIRRSIEKPTGSCSSCRSSPILTESEEGTETNAYTHTATQNTQDTFIDIPATYRLTMEDLKKMKLNSTGPGNFAKKVTERLFPELFTQNNERLKYSYFGGGIRGKKELDSVGKTYVERYVLYFYPMFRDHEAWKERIVSMLSKRIAISAHFLVS